MSSPHLYLEDPHFKMSRVFLSDKTYNEAIESFVIVDVDVIFINRVNKTILLLAKRRVKPMQGLWLIGGRVFAGESENDAIMRCVKRETSLDLPNDRFHFITMNRYIWKDREQEPQDKGSDNLCYTFAAELSPEERVTASNHLDKDEYDTKIGLQEFSLESLKEHKVHQAILDLYQLLFPFTS
ncbi:MAG: NUDIX domain-containing protein [Candidatus Taylorbacteria bacterium]|nr:NUDIX domain-containing protein [Candidatus Taylorbacteria bacterium]